ncbi:P-loop containing nucleoside triphosphate hydrolase protein [Russula earlei]|uniref:P-loop containing nucleoside triphosphate hydrolase protein n=1 Tax=Russula earlei TaxID=71964 RepID=A0ACC0UJW2_9AGAM|nr:P-loop containing nucleoside triphosphate hydrolase protein [Russula earlei]
MTQQGVSGSGKTTLAKGLAEALSLPFIDADDKHSEANKDKMRRGESLTDADRGPWLVSVRRAAVEAIAGTTQGPMGPISGVVVACSALKASYRDVLRGKERTDLEEERVDRVLPPQRRPPRTVFVHPIGPQSVLWERMTNRKGHFMKANMLRSQLDALESPTKTGEEGIVEIELEASEEEQVRAALKGLRTVGAI